MKYFNKNLLTVLTLGLCLSTTFAHAEAKFSIGAKLLPGHGWSGTNNRDGESDYQARATQLVLLGAFRVNRFYGAFSFQGAKYRFDNPAPDINDKLGSTQVDHQTIQLGESDLSFGYYVTPKFSVFADIKSVGYVWVDSARHISYTGLGLGVSGLHPVSPDWTLYGNFGVIGNMKVKSDGENIGKATGFALEFGGITRLSNSLSATVGMKVQGQALAFDSGATQNHARAGLVLGIVHQF